jgi:hypothetical protein
LCLLTLLASRPKLAERAKDGADVQNRTGDLVLTKDALCQLSYIGLRPVGFGQAVARRETVSRGGRRLERETGIEPATNSLEGCDSTTELLPPTRLTCSLSSAASGRPAAYVSRWLAALGLPAVARSLSGERRMVAREGLEPSKPLGRQIYSLLRLTASLPRQLAVGVWKTTCFGCTCDREFRRRSWRRDSNPRPADYKSAALPD